MDALPFVGALPFGPLEWVNHPPITSAIFHSCLNQVATSDDQLPEQPHGIRLHGSHHDPAKRDV
eukprot:8460162-Heterocapsa_arctica.AAC.1